jgi:hypothetical protein
MHKRISCASTLIERRYNAFLRGLVAAVCDRRRRMHKRISCASTLIERRYNAFLRGGL